MGHFHMEDRFGDVGDLWRVAFRGSGGHPCGGLRGPLVRLPASHACNNRPAGAPHQPRPLPRVPRPLLAQRPTFISLPTSLSRHAATCGGFGSIKKLLAFACQNFCRVERSFISWLLMGVQVDRWEEIEVIVVVPASPAARFASTGVLCFTKASKERLELCTILFVVI